VAVSPFLQNRRDINYLPTGFVKVYIIFLVAASNCINVTPYLVRMNSIRTFFKRRGNKTKRFADKL
jgi:hypothetical protein